MLTARLLAGAGDAPPVPAGGDVVASALWGGLAVLLAAGAAAVVVPPRGAARRLGAVPCRPAAAPAGARGSPGGGGARAGAVAAACRGPAAAARTAGPSTDRPVALGRTRPAAPAGVHRRALVLALVVGLAVAVGTGGAAGLLLGTLTGAAATVVLRRPAVGAGGVERQEAADLPLALDLLSACCGAGVPLLTAVEAVADAVGGPLGRSWAQGAVAVRLGADPVDAWGGAGAADRAGRLLAAAAASGHGLAEDLRRLAAEEREAARRRGEAAARRAGVLAVLPLGLCFLPAFVLVGVVPVVLGLARGVLG